ncbi:MAG: CvpA family protein [Candidatus Enterenecus sp.]
MSAYIFDIAIVAILAFFAWRGGKKGLILTLFGLAGLFVAFFGAKFLSGALQEPVADLIQPSIYRTIQSVEVDTAEGTLTVEELLDAVEDSSLFSGLVRYLDEDALVQTGGRTAVQAVADSLAGLAAKEGLFALSFLVIQLAWFLIGRALDLAFHLPGLATLNLVGGVVLGLVKAVLLVVILVWLAQAAGWIPAEPTTPVVSLFTPTRLLELLDRLLV